MALARALVREPQVFLLDEPLSNLDAKLRASAREELQKFQKEIGTTAVYVTHDQVEAMALGDRVVIMDHGRVRQIGTPAEVYDDPADTFVATFLGSPPMNLLETGRRDPRVSPRARAGRRTAPAPAGAARFRFRCELTEYLGSERLAFGELEGDWGGPRGRLAVPVLGAGPGRRIGPGRRRRKGAPAVLRRRDGPPRGGAAGPVSRRTLRGAVARPGDGGAGRRLHRAPRRPAGRARRSSSSVSDARVGSDDAHVRRPRELPGAPGRRPPSGPRSRNSFLFTARVAGSRPDRRDASSRWP